jgi:uncharacterized ferredoxin-like protein
MARTQAGVVEKEALRMIATLMASSARTAPKARGVDDVQTMVLDGEDLETLAVAMEEQGKEHSEPLPASFTRDANNVRKSGCVVLIGCKGIPKGFPGASDKALNCGACGYKSCEQLDKARLRQGTDFGGPICAIQSIDLGIAVGSAAKMAMELNADNRIMYTIGAAAMRLKLMNSDIIMGIPISISGKSPFFDRKA